MKKKASDIAFLAIGLCLLLLLPLLSAWDVRAQACGQSFARFNISDSTGSSISNVAIELLTAPSDDQHKALWEKYGNQELGFQSDAFKIPSSIAEDLIKRNSPPSKTEDFCGNPLTQTAGKTRVKTWDEVLKNREGDEKNFGFCTMENGPGSYLLKISAPGYVTDYYIGSYLGGCDHVWKYVLTKTKAHKKQSSSVRNAQ